MINSNDSVVITDLSEIPTGYVQLIALTWALYDLFITMDDEIKFIWCQRFRWTSFLFLATRYFTLILVVMSAIVGTVSGFSHTACIRFYWFENIGTLILFSLVQQILQMRIYVMYGRSRKILLVNISLCLLEGAISGAVNYVYFDKMTFAVVPKSTIGSCFKVSQKKLAASWAAPLAYELWLACLALYKIYEEHEVMKALPGTSLLTLIVRDNIIYFLMIVAAMIFTIVCYVATDLNPGISATTILHAAGSIGGTRIVLSLLRGTNQPMQLSTTGRVHMPSNFGIGFLDPQSLPGDGRESGSLNEKPARMSDGTARPDLEAGWQAPATDHKPEIKRDAQMTGTSDAQHVESLLRSHKLSIDLRTSPVTLTSRSTCTIVSPSLSSSSQAALS